EQGGAQCRLEQSRIECVLNIEHIEPGHFAALYAVQSTNGLLGVELADSVTSEAAAWQALQDDSSPAHPPRFYKEWVVEQYLTDKTAQVERLEV
ncbi:MAG: hypothetical protein PHF24_10175, partial [Syntrophomonas sp.]|nr:hypothetical protein [Syntrophomonas sp.]